MFFNNISKKLFKPFWVITCTNIFYKLTIEIESMVKQLLCWKTKNIGLFTNILTILIQIINI